MNTIRKLKWSINEAEELERNEPSDSNMKAFIKDMVDSLNSESEEGDWVEAEFNKRTGKYILKCTNPDLGGSKYSARVWFTRRGKWYKKAFEQGAIESITGFPSLVIECPLSIMPPFDSDKVTLSELLSQDGLSLLSSKWHPRFNIIPRLYIQSCSLKDLDFYYQLDFIPKLYIINTKFTSLSIASSNPQRIKKLDA